MKFKKSLLEDINAGWELEDTESGLLDVIYDLERVAYELKNCIRGSYTNCTTYKELGMYLKNKAEELDYEADALMTLDELLTKDIELSEALSIEDAKRKIDQFPHQITINAEAEDEFKDFLLSKNISFIIDDHLTADGKHGKNSTFSLKYPKHENLTEDLESEDISHLIFDSHYGNKSVDGLDVCSLNEVDHYYEIVKNVHEAEMFNYHSDYWGNAKEYQEQNIELMDALSSYIDKMVEIYYDGEGIKGKLVGIAIDKQYNDIYHTKVVLDSIEELNESSKLKESYDEQDIEEFANQIRVIGPEYRGAPYPPFKKLCINESKIPDNMRFKSWDVSVIDGGKNIFFDCLTQEDFNDYDALEFIKEVKRAIDVMIDVYDFKKPFKLKIKAVCRDGGYYGRVEKVLSFNTAKD